MLQMIESHIVEIILALIATGSVPLIVKGWFNKPKTMADARKSEYEAAIVLLEGWEKMVESLKAEMGRMETRYEERIKLFEQKMEEKERWYVDRLEKKDEEIAALKADIIRLERKLARYEGMKDKLDVAKEEIHHQVEENLNKVKEPAEKKLLT